MRPRTKLATPSVQRTIVFSLWLALVFGLFAGRAGASDASLSTLASFQDTDHFEIDSAILGRKLSIFVRKPDGYDEADGPYPTVYAIDGDILFPILAPYHYLLTFDTDIPEAIVVGLAYGTFSPEEGNLRSYDYSWPPFGPEFGLAGAKDDNGGAAAFHRFFTEELMPKVESQYKSDASRRILIGQSRGAHFALYSAYQHPNAFWGRIASNPSLKPNKENFFQDLTGAEPSGSSLYFSSGENDWPRLRDEALSLFDHLNSQASLPWRLKTVTVPGGTHAANLVDVYRDGIKWLFNQEEISKVDGEAQH
ncbi:MAG: alpha/beta hydrolase-fold protein [Pseudomonadota bacterium]